MLNNRQLLILRELDRIMKKASTALELLDKHISEKHQSMKPLINKHQVRLVSKIITPMKETATLISQVLYDLRWPKANYLMSTVPEQEKIAQEKILIYTLRMNLEKMKQYNTAPDLLLLKQGGEFTEENFIACYGLENVLSDPETRLESLQSMVISVARVICYVIDCLVSLVVSLAKTISTGDIQFSGTYNSKGETPLALTITGYFQFFPNQSKNLHGIVQELNKAYDIFVTEFGAEDHDLYRTDNPRLYSSS